MRGGSALAGEAGATIAEVAQAVARVTDIMQEIAAASVEQGRVIEQVNQAITQMDEVTQQNAALVEEAAAAATSLEEQGRRLNEAGAFFTAEGAPFAKPPFHLSQASVRAAVGAAVGAIGWSTF